MIPNIVVNAAVGILLAATAVFILLSIYLLGRVFLRDKDTPRSTSMSGHSSNRDQHKREKQIIDRDFTPANTNEALPPKETSKREKQIVARTLSSLNTNVDSPAASNHQPPDNNPRSNRRPFWRKRSASPPAPVEEDDGNLSTIGNYHNGKKPS